MIEITFATTAANAFQDSARGNMIVIERPGPTYPVFDESCATEFIAQIPTGLRFEREDNGDHTIRWEIRAPDGSLCGAVDEPSVFAASADVSSDVQQVMRSFNFKVRGAGRYTAHVLVDGKELHVFAVNVAKVVGHVRITAGGTLFQDQQGRVGDEQYMKVRVPFFVESNSGTTEQLMATLKQTVGGSWNDPLEVTLPKPYSAYGTNPRVLEMFSAVARQLASMLFGGLPGAVGFTASHNIMAGGPTLSVVVPEIGESNASW